MNRDSIAHILSLHAAGLDADQIAGVLADGAAADEQEARADSLAAADYEDRMHGDDYAVQLGERTYRVNEGGEPIGYM